MAQLSPHPHHSLDRWLRRIDHAAEAMNPFLLVLAIGLVVLNLTRVGMLVSHWPIGHGRPGVSACPPPSDDGPAAGSPASSEARSWTLY